MPISVNYDSAVVVDGTPQVLPYEINSTAQTIFLRFLVPDHASIVAINSIEVTLRVHDDVRDPAFNPNEAANVSFAMPGRAPFDLPLGFVDTTDLEGTSASAPFVFSYALEPIEILYVTTFGAFDNGAFRIQVRRCCGDFLVMDGQVAIDAELLLVPEPGSLALLTAAVGAFGLSRRRRKA